MSGLPKDFAENPPVSSTGPGPDGLIKVRDLSEDEVAEYQRRKARQDQPNFHEVVASALEDIAARQSIQFGEPELEKLSKEFDSDEALSILHPSLVAWKKEFLTIQNETIQANKLVFLELAKRTPPPQTKMAPKLLKGDSPLSTGKQQKEQIAKAITSLERAIKDLEKLMQEDAVMASLQTIKARRNIDKAGQGRRAGVALGSSAVVGEVVDVLATNTLPPVVEGMKRELQDLKAYTKGSGAPAQQLAEVAVLLGNIILALGLRLSHYQNGEFAKLFKTWQVYWSVECSVEHALKTAIKTISAVKGSK